MHIVTVLEVHMYIVFLTFLTVLHELLAKSKVLTPLSQHSCITEMSYLACYIPVILEQKQKKNWLTTKLSAVKRISAAVYIR